MKEEQGLSPLTGVKSTRIAFELSRDEFGWLMFALGMARGSCVAEDEAETAAAIVRLANTLDQTARRLPAESTDPQAVQAEIRERES